MQKEVCGCAEDAKDGGVIPATEFPRDGGMANEEERAKTSRTRCKHGHLIQHTWIHSRTSSRHYTFEACIFGADRVRCGVGEVDVLGEGLDESDFFGVIGYPFAL